MVTLPRPTSGEHRLFSEERLLYLQVKCNETSQGTIVEYITETLVFCYSKSGPAYQHHGQLSFLEIQYLRSQCLNAKP